MTQDLRRAVRTLTRRPGFTALVSLMLALGIGLTTAMFTLADTLLLSPAPFPAADRLAQVYMGDERGGRLEVSVAVFRAWRASPAFERVESVTSGTVLLETDDGVVARSSASVTAGLFDMLDVRPLHGRLFRPGEGRNGAEDFVVVSADLWRSAFGEDPSLVGRRIDSDGRSMLVIGILPAGFRFPRWDTVVWTPVAFDVPPPGREPGLPMPYVRFAPDIPEADALRLATVAARAVDSATSELFARSWPLAGLVLDPYYARAVPLLFGGVGLVLLVLCANVSSLLLVRLATRRRELGVRSALGASRGRLLQQSLTEHAVLGILGSAAGLMLAWMLVAIARGFLPGALLLRTLNPLDLDVRALTVASGVGVLATLLAGVLPAWIGSRADPVTSLRIGDRSGTDTRASRFLTRGLLATEIALACTLLAGSAVLVRSFVNLVRADRGLETRNVVTAWIALPLGGPLSRMAATSAIEGAVRALPGIQQVALSYGIPPAGGAIHFYDDLRSDRPGASALEMTVDEYDVSPDFFELYRIPLLSGRTFQLGDAFSDVIVGERLAARLWPGTNAVGRTFTADNGASRRRVIGVAREIHHPSVDSRLDRPEFYSPLLQPAGRAQFMMSVRCEDLCPDGAVIRRTVLAISPAIRVLDVGPLDDEYFEQLAGPLAAAALGLVFSAVAVAGAAVGLFSVLTYAVGRRRRELGIRSALGATAGEIRRLVVREGVAVVALGTALGLTAGWALARSLSALLYGVTASDPLSWSVVLGVLALAAIAATWRPASQAARVDPVMLLRDE